MGPLGGPSAVGDRGADAMLEATTASVGEVSAVYWRKTTAGYHGFRARRVRGRRARVWVSLCGCFAAPTLRGVHPARPVPRLTCSWCLSCAGLLGDKFEAGPGARGGEGGR